MHATRMQVVSVTARITTQQNDEKERIKTSTSGAASVSLTVDIWSDRTIRDFPGITAHFMDRNLVRSMSALIGCDRFKGSHTTERINEAVDEVCADYDLMGKITHIITDNAANMRKASTVTFPIPSTEGDDDEEQKLEVQNKNLWEALSEEDSGDVTHRLTNARKTTSLQCFTHS